ncbi:MAG: NADH-quinone oxidoreductase subunit NuoF [candidate division Zixibacteria bacterium]|nr:NADH-quinone oxidoreductase subunit NuoF [candidate division Zixibacteria bacterium]
MAEKILFKYIDYPDQHKIDVYMKNGGYTALSKALKEFKPEELVEMVKKTNLRGRGGAGFPAGVKWSFLPKGINKPTYLIINADESEPGTFKDRQLMEYDPHQMIEGTIITSYAINCHTAFVYIRGEFTYCAEQTEKAINEAREKGFIGKNILGSGFDLDIHIFRGGGAYICGEETSLMESIEGWRAMSRQKPPFPAVEGLWGCPTIINNVETISNIPHIVNNGADWFASIGTEKSTGTKIYCLSGHINRPGNYELEMGVTLRELIYEYGGGIIDDKPLKAVIPGGSSVPILKADEIDINMDFESLAEKGSMLGSAGVIVMHDGACMVAALQKLTKFYEHESCGKCSPCREGTNWMDKILKRMLNGEGKPEDVDLLFDVAKNIMGNTVCPLGDAAAMPVMSFIEKFRDEFENLCNGGKPKGTIKFPFR